MANKKRSVRREPTSFVTEWDDRAKFKPGIHGLAELSELHELTDGAEIIELRPLDIFRRAECDAIDAFRPKKLKQALAGLVSVSVYGDNDTKGVRKKVTDPEELLAWLEALDDDGLWILIGGAVQALTDGTDVQRMMRLLLSRPAPEVAKPEESKSGNEEAAQE